MKVNILLCGKTGVGKSSIINSVFGKHVAEVDFGKPVTNEIEQFEDVQMSNHKVHFFDTKGFELNISGERDDGATKMKKFIEKCRWESSKNRIHLVWYLIDCSSARYEIVLIGLHLELRNNCVTFAKHCYMTCQLFLFSQRLIV
jgi:predicted GTPase